MVYLEDIDETFSFGDLIARLQEENAALWAEKRDVRTELESQGGLEAEMD